jgi:hypothetical protein
MPNVRNKSRSDMHVISGKGNFTLVAGQVTTVDDEAWKAASEKPGPALKEALDGKDVEVTGDPTGGQTTPLPEGPLPEGTRPEQVAAAQRDQEKRAQVAPAPVPSGATATQQPPAAGGALEEPSGSTDTYRKKK